MSATLKITSTTTQATHHRGLLDRWMSNKLGNGSMALLLEEEGRTYNVYNRRSLAAYMAKVNRTVKNQLVLASRGVGPALDKVVIETINFLGTLRIPELFHALPMDHPRVLESLVVAKSDNQRRSIVFNRHSNAVGRADSVVRQGDLHPKHDTRLQAIQLFGVGERDVVRDPLSAIGFCFIPEAIAKESCVASLRGSQSSSPRGACGRRDRRDKGSSIGCRE
jgi:hypothetical protein